MKSSAARPAGRLGRIFMVSLCLVLAGMLAVSVWALVRFDRQNRQLTDSLAAAQQQNASFAARLDQLESETRQQQNEAASARQQIAGLQSDLAAAESALAAAQSEAEQAKQSASSYQQQAARLEQRLQAAAPASSAPKAVSATAPAAQPTGENTCYLTFDDGPSANTPKILAVLAEYGVKATFFVCGTDKLDYVKQIHAAGHTVALHSYTHTYSQIYASQKAYFADLDKLSAAVEKRIGLAPKVLRFPGGSSNTVSRHYCTGIMTALTGEVQNRGYVYFDWNVDSWDATGNGVPVNTIMSHIRSEGGHHARDVVLMHDSGAKTTTVQALPQIIEFYRAKGYGFAALTTATPPVTHRVNN